MRLRTPAQIWQSMRELTDWCRQAVEVESYTVATLPETPAKPTWIYVSNATGGACMAFNDLSDSTWRRCDTRAVVS